MISEQTVIDILFFLLWYVVFYVELGIFLTLMLQPRYGRALTVTLTVLIDFALKCLCESFFADNSLIRFVISLIMLVVPVFVLFKDISRVKLFALLLSFLYALLTDIVMSALSTMTLGYVAANTRPLTWVSVLYMLYADILFAVMFILVLFFWNKKIRNYNPKSIGFFILFPIGQAVFISAGYYPGWISGSGYDIFGNPFMLLALIISIISDVLMFVALRDNDNLQRTRGRVAEMEKQMELQLQYYDNLADKFTEIREYRHDINNLVSVAEALINDSSSESSKAFIGEMKEKALNMKVPMFCENSIVNAILWKKQSEALEKGLEFTAAVDRTEKFPLDRIDVCSLLANLLDNAIREAEEQPDGFVRVIIGRKHGLLIIDVSNSTAREYSAAERLPQTTKNGDHGHGMEIADKISRKYNGKFVFKAEGGTAHAIVSLLTDEETR